MLSSFDLAFRPLLRGRFEVVNAVFVQQTMKTASSDEDLAFKQLLAKKTHGFGRWMGLVVSLCKATGSFHTKVLYVSIFWEL